jgi:hypothetical protein
MTVRSSRWSRLLVPLALLLLLAALLAECSSSPVSEEDVVGTWVAPTGGTIEFRPDHTFTAERLAIQEADEENLPKLLSAQGRWILVAPYRSAPQRLEIDQNRVATTFYTRNHWGTRQLYLLVGPVGVDRVLVLDKR